MPKIDTTLWFGRIQRAEDLQATRSNERKQILKLYKGEFFGNPLNNNSEISEENFVYEYMQILVSAIYARNPYIFVRTKNTLLGDFTTTMETVLNYYIHEKHFKQKVKKTIIDSILQTPGFMEIGYFLLTEKRKIEKEIEDEFPELKEVNPKPPKTEEEQGITDETIVEDDVFINYVSSWDILFPDGYHDIRECPYIIKKQKLTLDKILANPMYKNTEVLKKRTSTRDSISAIKPYDMNAMPRNTPYSGTDNELVPITLYHVFDRMSRKRFTLAKEVVDKPLFEGDWDYLIEGHTIYPLIFNEVPKTDDESNAFGMSDVVPMIPQLKELSLISSAMLRHRKRAGTLLLAKTGSISEGEAAKIQESSDVDLILVNDNSEGAIRGFTPPALPQDFYALRSLILEDLMRVSGYNQLLGVAKGVQTATESENVKMGAVLRQSEKVDVIEDFTVQVFIGLAGLIWQFIPRKRIAEIIGTEVTEKMWPTLPTDMAEARRVIRQLAITIEAGSSKPPKDEAIERKQWGDLVGFVKANFPGRIKDEIFLPQLLKKWNATDIDSMIVKFDDEEIATAQQENELLLQGIPQLISPNENHMLHLKVHSQAYQTPGLQMTDQMHEHILKHQQYYEMQNPQVTPQKGDSKAAPVTTTPKQNRQGVTDFADILGSVNASPGIGTNTGGRQV